MSLSILFPGITLDVSNEHIHILKSVFHWKAFNYTFKNRKYCHFDSTAFGKMILPIYKKIKYFF